jgi:hypothetical protein
MPVYIFVGGTIIALIILKVEEDIIVKFRVIFSIAIIIILGLIVGVAIIIVIILGEF